MSVPPPPIRTYSRKHRMDSEALQRNSKRVKQTPAQLQDTEQVFVLPSSVGQHISPKDFSPVPARPIAPATISKRLKENNRTRSETSRALSSPFKRPGQGQPFQRTHVISQSTQATPITSDSIKLQHNRRPSVPTPQKTEEFCWIVPRDSSVSADTDHHRKIDFDRPPSQVDFNMLDIHLDSFMDFVATSTPPPPSALSSARSSSTVPDSDSSDEDIFRSIPLNSSDEESPVFSSSSSTSKAANNSTQLKRAISLPDSEVVSAKEMDIRRMFASLEIEPRQRLLRSTSMDASVDHSSDHVHADSSKPSSSSQPKGRARRGTIKASEHNPADYLQPVPGAPGARRTRSGTVVGPAHRTAAPEMPTAASSSISALDPLSQDRYTSPPKDQDSDDELLIIGQWRDEDWPVAPGVVGSNPSLPATKRRNGKKVEA